MPKIVNVHEAKTQLSRILEEVEAGTDVIIARAGKPIARLVPLEPLARKKTLGQLKGKIRIPDDFDAPLDDATLASFEGR